MVVNTIRGTTVEISESLFATAFDLPTEGLMDLSDVPMNLVFDARSLFSDSTYEAALTEFFTNSSVREDGMVVNTIRGTTVEISESLFATAFDLPTEGLMDLSDVPMNLVFDARSLFSDSKEQEMVNPGSRQAKGFAIQICAIFKTVPGLVLGESRVFPASWVLTKKTIHLYVAVNDNVGGEADTDAPRVKKTPVKKAVSHKRPAVDIETAPVVKKKRTTKGKPFVIAQGEVPLQIVEAAADAPVEQHPVPKRKSHKRKWRLILEDDLEVDEPVAGGSTAEHPVEEAVTDVQEPDPESVEQPAVVPVVAPATDDPDAVIKKVLNQLDVVFRTDDGEQPQGTVVEETVVAAKETQGPTDERHWFDLPYDDLIARWDAERPVVTASDTVEDVETMDVGAAGGDQQVQFSEEEPEDVEMNDDKQSVDELIDADEKMSLEDILITIPVDVQLPSAGIEITKITMGKEIKIPGIDERTRYLASLPQIPVDNKEGHSCGERPYEGQPGQGTLFFDFFKKLETINIEELSKNEDQVLCWGETETTHVALNRKRYILLKYREVLVRKFLESWKNNFVPGEGSSATDLKVKDMLSDLHLFVLEELREQALAHGLQWTRTCCSKIVEWSPCDRGAIIARTNTNTPSTRLQPVGSIKFCKSLSVDAPAYRVAPRPSPVFALRVSQFCTVFIVYSLFSWLPTADITDFLSSIAMDRTVFRSVQVAQNTVSVAPIVQMIDEPSSSKSSSDDILMDFVGHDTTTATSHSPQTISADVQNLLDQLRASVDLLQFELLEHKDDVKKIRETLSLHIYNLERTLSDRFDAHDRTYRKVSIQVGADALDTVDVRREVKEMNAKVDILSSRLDDVKKDVEATKEAISHQLLEFQSQAQANHIVLTDQLGQLVDYINRGGNAKKGEGESSRGPQTPPAVQIRDSGNAGGSGDAVRTTELTQEDIDAANR
ncbi:hypothetical protein F511_28832 [Dorcoceras hygrometricum]|uniref:Uncharacterized protein n=1 Tax=Dorcoceras hygrometricum TaxID=472368 RepID=A0A2Z7DIG5_9LAMI|nr:hypothetical protein F511_28832 [Dorcoceras hygrometricum]